METNWSVYLRIRNHRYTPWNGEEEFTQSVIDFDNCDEALKWFIRERKVWIQHADKYNEITHTWEDERGLNFAVVKDGAAYMFLELRPKPDIDFDDLPF